MRNILIAAALALGLSACAPTLDLIEAGRPYAAETAKELALTACSLPMPERQKNAEAVAAKLAEVGSTIKFTLDCDGDGQPDFLPPAQ